MILADENIDPRLIHALREVHLDVFSVREHFPGIADRQIIELSKETDRIILTEDKDFGEWVFSHGVQDISVIFLRYRFPDTHLIIDILKRLLLSKGAGLYGKFTTVTIDKIRIRDL